MTDQARRFKGGEVVFSEKQVTKAVDQLAVRLSARLESLAPTLVCMMNGGLVLSAALLQRLHMPVRFDYIHLSRYRNEARGGEIEWLVRPRASLKGRTVLLVDDICDQGLSLAAAVSEIRATRAKEVVTAVLVQRRGGSTRYSADFAALECGEGFLVGWGMDYEGLERNDRAIRKLHLDEANN